MKKEQETVHCVPFPVPFCSLSFQFLFQDVEGQPEDKAFPAVLKIYAGYFADAVRGAGAEFPLCLF